MYPSQIRKLRLFHQLISSSNSKSPAEVVNHLIAMQAQEFRHAKWAIGLRLPGSTDADIEKAFNKGEILRTHAMRPTWHFVTPADIHWWLKLTAPRVHVANEPYYRKFEITKALLKRCHNIIGRALENGNYLQRTEIQEILNQNKIKADGPRLAYIMMHAELEGLICSGPRIGKQFSYALLSERAPGVSSFDREQALANFLLRYFRSRGPASLHDFTYWSGLTLKDARAGIESVNGQLQRTVINGKEYYSGDLTLPKIVGGQDTFIMPDYDEYGMSYKDRSSLVPILKNKQFKTDNWSIFGHYIVVKGIMQGSWKEEIIKDIMKISTRFVEPLSPLLKRKVENALVLYSSFFGKKLQSTQQ